MPSDLEAHRTLLARLAAHTPLLPGADVLAFLDLDSVQKRIYGPRLSDLGRPGVDIWHAKVPRRAIYGGDRRE